MVFQNAVDSEIDALAVWLSLICYLYETQVSPNGNQNLLCRDVATESHNLQIYSNFPTTTTRHNADDKSTNHKPMMMPLAHFRPQQYRRRFTATEPSVGKTDKKRALQALCIEKIKNKSNLVQILCRKAQYNSGT